MNHSKYFHLILLTSLYYTYYKNLNYRHIALNVLLVDSIAQKCVFQCVFPEYSSPKGLTQG